MSKTIYEKEIGSDGAKAGLYVDGQNLSLHVSYPLAKVVEPATKAVDSLIDKLEKLIPGDWDKPMLEKVKEEYKEELVKLLAE